MFCFGLEQAFEHRHSDVVGSKSPVHRSMNPWSALQDLLSLAAPHLSDIKFRELVFLASNLPEVVEYFAEM